MSVVETAELCKRYVTKRHVVEAVRGIDLKVEAGEIYGLLGPNGAGKTTTLRMLTTLLPPSGGSARVVGHDLIKAPEKVREHIGYVSQTGGVDSTATARENLTLQARLHGLTRARAGARVDQLLQLLDLELGGRQARTFSGGQRRRLDMALGLVHEPKLLLLDEPTIGLDPPSRAGLWQEINHLKRRGVTVLLSTHYLEEADALCDRLAIIDNGRIVVRGTPSELKSRIGRDVVTLAFEDHDPDEVLEKAAAILSRASYDRQKRSGRTLRLYVSHGEEAVPIILRTLDDSGLSVGSLTLTQPTLNDVFLEHTGRSLGNDAAGRSGAA